jgi:putative tryptophan/tyrosine transport system substrate-binding protein
MRRREFIKVIAGSAVSWPLTTRTQASDKPRRIGVLVGGGESDPEFRAAAAAFTRRLQQLGWTEGRNIQFEYRWGQGKSDDIDRYATELAALAPDLIVVSGTAAVGPLIHATHTVPIVFVNVPDPVGSGYVESLARPGGNVTGFTNFEYGLSAKWLQLLKEIAPSTTRASILRDADLAAGVRQFETIRAAASSMGMEVSPIDVRDAAEIEDAIASFARLPNGGLIVTQSGLALVHRQLIIALAAQHSLPSVYVNRLWTVAGGLSSYGASIANEFQRGAEYVDRILKGEKPADLPVQTPIKFELVLNLKTARALGLEVPPKVLTLADEVIE